MKRWNCSSGAHGVERGILRDVHDLSNRGRRILFATITEYIQNGDPVGSRRLAKGYGINLSPATIRNELKDLEDAGFLLQPHSSAGRVPTTAGFRVFVDALVQMREVPADERSRVIERLQSLEEGLDPLKEAGELLSALTGAAAVLRAPRLEEEALSQVRFMPLREGELLAILVSRTGAVQNRVLQVADTLSTAELERVHNLLDELFASESKSLLAVRERLAQDLTAQEVTARRLRVQAQAILDVAVGKSTPGDLIIEGQDRLFDRPEFLDVEKIRRYLRAFDDRGRLLELLEQTLSAGGVRVVIGSEAGLPEVDDVTVISSTLRGGGSIGVISPTRIDYGKVMPLVEFTARAVDKVITGDDTERE